MQATRATLSQGGLGPAGGPSLALPLKDFHG